MQNDICSDNRFELIAKYKNKLIESTNIETNVDEMNVIDNILFRFWQMGWLDKLEQKPCDTCKYYESRCTWLPEEPEENPCEDCMFEEGSKYCIEHCPYDASREMEKLPSVKRLRNNQKIIDKCLGRNKEIENNDVISRENRIKDLIGAIENDDCNYWTPTKIASMLKQLLSVTLSRPTDHKPICDDCIYFDNGKGSEKCDSCELTGTNKLNRRKGHWVKTGQSFLNPNKFRNFCCTECLHELDEHIRKEPKYCPNCGAEMKGEK